MGKGVLTRRRSPLKERNSCNVLPHCLGAVGSATLAMHSPTGWGVWAVQLLSCTATPLRGSGQWIFYKALPHYLGAVGSAPPAMHCLTSWGQWAVQLPQCTATSSRGNVWAHQLGGRGVVPRKRSCLKTQLSSCSALVPAVGQWAVQLLQCAASLPGGSGQWNSCNALPHCQWAVGSATPAMHCLTAGGHWAVQLLQCNATLPWDSGQCNSRHALPHCVGALGSGTPAMRRPTSWGNGEPCPRGGRCLKSGTPAMHCHTARGQWVVQLLQCTTSLPGGSGH